jgi:hypothetical protein
VGFGHSMTWSARRSSEGGIVRPRAFEGHRNVGVEPIVHQPQLRRLVGHEHRGERGAEAAGRHVVPLRVDPLACCPDARVLCDPRLRMAIW